MTDENKQTVPGTAEEKLQADKNHVGIIVFRVLFVMGLFLLAAIFYVLLSVLSGMEKAGVGSEITTALFGLTLFFAPLFLSALLATFTRLIVGCSAGKSVVKYTSIISAFSCPVTVIFRGTGFRFSFIPLVALSVFIAEGILTYNGGGIINHYKNQLRGFYKNHIKKFFQK